MKSDLQMEKARGRLPNGYLDCFDPFMMAGNMGAVAAPY